MRAMRKRAVLLVVVSALAAPRVTAQTCPPNDPLCATGKAKPPPAKDPSPSPAATPEAPASLAAADEQRALEKSKTAEAETRKAEKKKEESDKPARGVITLAEVTITGRIQKPIAAVDVNRIAPRLTLAELRQPFLDRIEKAIYSDPF